MVNKCCLIYCKSEANGFSFPSAQKYPDLRKKWIQFVSERNFEPSSHSRICMHHFEEQFIKFGQRNHLKWELLPVLTIHTNDVNDKNVSPSSPSVPKVPRKEPRKRIFQEDQMGEFLMKDRIQDFSSITESDCLPGFTFVKQEGIIIMYRLVIDKDTKIAMVKEQISID